MRVFMTGATGYIGSRLAKSLMANGHSLQGLARSDDSKVKLEKRGILPVEGRLEEPDSFIEIARMSDAIIHLGFNHDYDHWDQASDADFRLVEAFVKALKGTNKTLLVTSDAGVLGDTGDQVADETFPIPQNFPLSLRARSEERVISSAQQGVRGIVVRLPIFVYGPEDNGFLTTMIDTAATEGRVYVINKGIHKVAALHVDDAVSLFCDALEKSPPGRLYQGQGDEGQSVLQVAQAISRRMHYPVAEISFEEASKLWGRAVAYFLSINNQLSAKRAEKELGWQPNYKNYFMRWIGEDVSLPSQRT